LRLEIAQVLEFERHVQLRALLSRELVRDAQTDAGVRSGEDVVEVVAIDVDELPVLHRDLLAFLVEHRLPGEIGEDAHHERQLLHLDGAAGLDIVRDVDARLSDAADLFLGALARHGLAPRPAVPGPFYRSKNMRYALRLLTVKVAPGTAGS